MVKTIAAGLLRLKIFPDPGPLSRRERGDYHMVIHAIAEK
jgi:hypothetical protein